MIFLKLFEPLGADFVVYFEAAKVFLAGTNPYLGLITRTFPFNYPPISLLFLFPLGFLDYVTANIIWNILSTLAVLVSIWLIGEIGQIGFELHRDGIGQRRTGDARRQSQGRRFSEDHAKYGMGQGTEHAGYLEHGLHV